MNNLLAFPMILPVVVGVLLIFVRNYPTIQRLASVVTAGVVLIISGFVLSDIQQNGIQTLHYGGWTAPFGITFVADSFAMLLVATASFISMICILYASFIKDGNREHYYLYTFMLLLLAGVNGSFMTGDLFNLFVCFEVMLLASYALMTLGGEKRQLREGLTYVLVNILSSWLFLLGIAYVYGTLGTLNFAHLSERIAEVGQPPLLTVIGILFLVVFSIKSGLVLYFWLPGSYSAVPTAVSAMFAALLTKVGVYALFRTFTLLFYHEPQVTHTLITWMAIATLIGGSVGALAYKDIRQIAAYNVIIAIGFILAGLAANTTAGIEGAIYYLVHDIAVKGLLFLLVGTIIYLTGQHALNKVSGLMTTYPLLGWIFFITVLSLGGIPPLSGFPGKFLIGQGAVSAGEYVLVFAAFASSLAVVYSLLRIFINMFFGEITIQKANQKPLSKRLMIPCMILGVFTVGLGLGMEGISPYVSSAAEVLMNPEIYIEGVLTND
ncbi:Na+/H+ antiporter subunit D [Jeotgalibacillus malaysiensis]|uniref:Na+/H+ antiporter subunit D n=1 Tax=Jeotgalibacillus malaysiensis TaxID=1508404 RepID=UPI00384B44CB